MLGRLVGLVLLLVLPACTSGPVEPRPSSPGTTSAAETCTFELVQYERERAHPSEEEDWEGIQEDITRAETYVGGFWERHWKECFPDVPYEAPASAGVYTADAPVTCGDRTITESDNAFYCPQGRYVAYGSELMHRAVDEGDALAYLVVAHEWGHAIQDLLRGTRHASLVAQRSELQADCLAGAALWGSNYEGYFEWQSGDTAEAVDALKSIADETEWAQQPASGGAAHGDAIQRITAFGQGRSTTGVTNCFGMTPSESDGTTPAPSPTDPSPSGEPTSPSPTPGSPDEIDAREHGLTGWASPSGNILCLGVGPSGTEEASVRCDVLEHTWTAPSRPSSCDTGTWGSSLEVVDGEADFACVGDPATTAEPGTDDTWWWSSGDPTTDGGLAELPYGASVRVGDDLRCSSRRTGMRCDSERTGHGFAVASGTVDHW